MLTLLLILIVGQRFYDYQVKKGADPWVWTMGAVGLYFGLYALNYFVILPFLYHQFLISIPNYLVLAILQNALPLIGSFILYFKMKNGGKEKSKIENTKEEIIPREKIQKIEKEEKSSPKIKDSSKPPGPDTV